ncbi:ATP-binding protein [Paenibacillus periandrae]|uniref:hybrid sensor histidine kinase/response regulator n=1 Tax=Paenibacillus periandrae TaxID=1761741 RepID=UPI001F08B883|nr:ATP-binding protein [Paenibacillus periandrae]
MSKTKILILIGIFLIVVTGLRLTWFVYHMTPEHPQVTAGVLDLRDWDLPSEHTISLNGQWEFYPNSLLHPNTIQTHSSTKEKSFIQVPSNWDSYPQLDSEAAFNVGTYRLRILTNHTMDQSYGIRIPKIQTASQLFVNARLLGGAGLPAESPDAYMAVDIPYSVFFTPDTPEIEVVIQVSNASRFGPGGIIQPIRFGFQPAINHETLFTMSMQLLLCVVLLLHAVYAILLYFIGTRQKALIYFALLNLFTILSVVVDDDRLLLIWMPIQQDWSLKVFFIAYIGLTAFFVQFMKHLFPDYTKMKVFVWFPYFCSLYSLFIVCANTEAIIKTWFLLAVILLLSNLIIPGILLRAVINGDMDAIFLLLGSVSIITNIVWGITRNAGSIEMTYYPFDLIINFLGFAIYWFKRSFRNSIEIVKLADKLKKVDKLKDDFLANTSHELRNPLHGIINIAQTVLDSDGKAMNDTNTRNMELLIHVGRRMTFLLNDLLDLNRLEENKIHLQRTRIDLHSVASGVVDMLQFMTEGKPIQLILNIPEPFPSVYADENRLVQILFNLIHNAIKYTNEGYVTITAQVEAGMASIHIADTGTGMDEEVRLRIFQRYEQGDSSITAVGGGLGLGLNICKQLVELHGGNIHVSATSSQGSVFTFTLPLFNPAEKQEANQREPHASSSIYGSLEVISESAAAVSSEVSEHFSEPIAVSSGSKQRILAVDDDPLNLKILQSMLEIENYDIVTVTNGKEAIARVIREHWDLVITDIMMPHMSGYELSRLIRERFSLSELPILLLTARSRSEDIYTGFLAGANDYVIKPMDALELKSRVRALTDLKKSIGEQLRMEAAWLHAQIKPHFLFNTLNSISALGDLDIERMRLLLEVFGTYMRSSFSLQNLEPEVTLDNEIELVRSYLYIEKERFDERLQVVWEIQQHLHAKLPPLSIQTLVENALNHGVLKRANGGTVQIRIRPIADYIEISIIDNGVGMDEQKLKGLLDGHHDKKSGIGLFNTDQRLKQLYGAGLQIQSKVDQGTTVSFIIPNISFRSNNV